MTNEPSDNTVEGEIVSGSDYSNRGEQSPLLPSIIPAYPYLPTPRPRGNWLPALNLEGLRDKPKNVRAVKSRPGKGGTLIDYVTWTGVADVYDDVIGPGQWNISVAKKHDGTDWIEWWPRKNGTIYECVVKCIVVIDGMLMPIEVFGWGDYYVDTDGAHRSDAIETAISRALTKSGARVSKYIRAVWGKDDETIRAITGAPKATIDGMKMMINNVTNLGKEAEALEMIKRFTGEASVDSLNRLTVAEAADLGREIAKMAMPTRND